VDISGVTMRDSRFWTLHLYKCSDVYVHDCRIEARVLEGVKGPSTDAIDLDVVTNAVIRRVYMNVNDDAVVLKGGRGPWADDPVRHPDNGGNSNILVEDCTFGSCCHACLTLGSECIVAENVVMRNSHVENVGMLLHMKMRPDTHFEYRNVMISNLTGRVRRGVAAFPWRQYFDLEGRKDLPKSHIENIVVKCPDLYAEKPFQVETVGYCAMTNVISEMKGP
jgi:polygalacturonase